MSSITDRSIERNPGSYASQNNSPERSATRNNPALQTFTCSPPGPMHSVGNLYKLDNDRETSSPLAIRRPNPHASGSSSAAAKSTSVASERIATGDRRR